MKSIQDWFQGKGISNSKKDVISIKEQTGSQKSRTLEHVELKSSTFDNNVQLSSESKESKLVRSETPVNTEPVIIPVINSGKPAPSNRSFDRPAPPAGR